MSLGNYSPTYQVEQDSDGGYLPGDIAANLLLDLDYSRPTRQVFDTTAADLAARLGGGLVAGDIEEIWDFTETSGNFVGEVASTALVPSGAAIIHDTVASGLFNGTDCHSIKAMSVNIDGSAVNAAQDAGSDIGDCAENELIGVLVCFRFYGAIAANRLIVHKREQGPGVGWEIRTGSVGELQLVIEGPSGETTVSVAGNHADGGWHYALALIDSTTGSKAYNLFTDLGSGSEDNTDQGDTTSTVGISVGNDDGAALDGTAQCQVKHLAIIRGKAVTAAMGASYWNHGKDPGVAGTLSPPLDTYTRASAASPVIGYESGFGVRVATYGSGQFAHTHNANATHVPTGLGALCEEAATNICPGSQTLGDAGWAATNVTKAADIAKSPDGTQTAATVTATADAGNVQRLYLNDPNETYILSVFIRRNGGSDVTGRIVFWDAVGATEADAAAFTATSEWTRIEATLTATANIVHGWRLEIDNDTDSVFVWGFQCEVKGEETKASSYIKTTAAAATRALTNMRLTNTAEQYLQGDKGEIRCTWWGTSETSEAGTRHMLDVSSGDNTNRFLLRVSSDEAHDFLIWDSAQVLKANVAEAAGQTYLDEEADIRCRWNALDDELDGNDENSDIIANRTRTAGTDNTWTMTGAGTTMYIGQASTGAQQLNGGLAKLQVWDKPRRQGAVV